MRQGPYACVGQDAKGAAAVSEERNWLQDFIEALNQDKKAEEYHLLTKAIIGGAVDQSSDEKEEEEIRLRVEEIIARFVKDGIE